MLLSCKSVVCWECFLAHCALVVHRVPAFAFFSARSVFLCLVVFSVWVPSIVLHLVLFVFSFLAVGLTFSLYFSHLALGELYWFLLINFFSSVLCVSAEWRLVYTFVLVYSTSQFFCCDFGPCGSLFMLLFCV